MLDELELPEPEPELDGVDGGLTGTTGVTGALGVTDALLDELPVLVDPPEAAVVAGDGVVGCVAALCAGRRRAGALCFAGLAAGELAGAGERVDVAGALAWTGAMLGLLPLSDSTAAITPATSSAPPPARSPRRPGRPRAWARRESAGGRGGNVTNGAGAGGAGAGAGAADDAAAPTGAAPAVHLASAAAVSAEAAAEAPAAAEAATAGAASAAGKLVVGAASAAAKLVASSAAATGSTVAPALAAVDVGDASSSAGISASAAANARSARAILSSIARQCRQLSRCRSSSPVWLALSSPFARAAKRVIAVSQSSSCSAASIPRHPARVGTLDPYAAATVRVIRSSSAFSDERLALAPHEVRT